MSTVIFLIFLCVFSFYGSVFGIDENHYEIQDPKEPQYQAMAEVALMYLKKQQNKPLDYPLTLKYIEDVQRLSQNETLSHRIMFDAADTSNPCEEMFKCIAYMSGNKGRRDGAYATDPRVHCKKSLGYICVEKRAEKMSGKLTDSHGEERIQDHNDPKYKKMAEAKLDELKPILEADVYVSHVVRVTTQKKTAGVKTRINFIVNGPQECSHEYYCYTAIVDPPTRGGKKDGSVTCVHQLLPICKTGGKDKPIAG